MRTDVLQLWNATKNRRLTSHLDRNPKRQQPIVVTYRLQIVAFLLNNMHNAYFSLVAVRGSRAYRVEVVAIMI